MTIKRTSRRPRTLGGSYLVLVENVVRRAPADMASFGLTSATISKIKVLGEGSNGVAFLLPQGHVLKITRDTDEGGLAKRILDKGGVVRGLPRIFYAAQMDLKEPWHGERRVHLIVMERVETSHDKNYLAFDRMLVGEEPIDESNSFIQDLTEAVRFIVRRKVGPTEALYVAWDELDIHSENLGTVRRGGRDMLVVFDLGQYEEDVARVPVAKNPSERPRGFPWKKKATVYHATTAMRAILRDGFKTRREIGGTNALGGGTDAAVSFTLDHRVAVSIALGLRTIRDIGRGEIGLGDLIIQAQQVAPHVYPQVKKNLELDLHANSPEDVERIDRGLRWVRIVPVDAERRRIEQLVDDGVFEVVHRDKYIIEGWLPCRLYAEIKNEEDRKVHERLRPGTPFDDRALLNWDRFQKYRSGVVEAYKLLLHFGGWSGPEGSAFYNPLFFGTDLGHLSRVDDRDLGVVSARLNADWLCAESSGAESLGYQPPLAPSTMSDWAHGCERELDRGRYGDDARGPKARTEYHSTLPRDWDPPDPSDTIALMSSMSEVRVWDTKIIGSVEADSDLNDVLNAARDAWDRKGHVVDEPYWMPHHRDVPRFGWIPE